MTGPEHYRKAEEILGALKSARADANRRIVPERAAVTLAEAQVHATLALAAVTAHHMVATSGSDREEWSKAIHGRAVVCVHPEHYEGECPCPPSCVCCGSTPAPPAGPESLLCGPVPDVCDAEAGDPCRNHEREQAHGEGDHAFCGPECTGGAEPAASTLAAWLNQRFDPRGPNWDRLDEDDRSYWEHHARAVRRAVARGGFKTPADPAAPEATP
ncbi:hypothetical protein [Streptomyces anulatus]|uniref:hypothetical protein n=1 Tax=Streptomyces anulatus TaxID=1892 RepID=UPI00364A469D